MEETFNSNSNPKEASIAQWTLKQSTTRDKEE